MKLLKFVVYNKNILFYCKRLLCSGNRITRSTMETVRVSLLLRIPEISKANVKILNPELVCDKLRRMSEQNKKTLQIVSDFDLTLTKPTVNGKPAVGSLEIFKIMEETPDELIKCGREMMREYYKVIKDPNLTMDKRIEMTDQILAKFEKSLSEIPIPDDTPFVREAEKGIFVLRDGTAEAFKMLKDSSVPVLVLSGGLACIINYVLKEQGLLDSNVHVLANSYKYKDGNIESFDGDVVHFFNKNICYLKSEIYKKELSKRQNIILLGDSSSDATMTDGVPDNFNVLKIGFYHKNLWEDGLEKFQKQFDIVITEDETMHAVNAIIKYVLSSSQT